MHFNAPTSDPRPEGFEPWEIDAVKACVASFIAARGSFRTHDFDDLVQEGLLAWLEQRGRYSPARGSTGKTFLNRIVTNRLKDLRREELAEKRQADRTAVSLEATQSNRDANPEVGLEDPQAEDPLALQN